MSNLLEKYPSAQPRSAARRKARNITFTVLCILTASASIGVLAILLLSVLSRGLDHLDGDFLTSFPSADPENAGMGPAIWGSVWICIVCGLSALPIGVGTAVFLEEYRPRARWARKIHGFLQLNITNLAGVPSIVYGIIGLTIFVNMFGLFGDFDEPSVQVGMNYYAEYISESGEPLLLTLDEPGVVPALTDGMVLKMENGDRVEIDVVTEGESTGALHEVCVTAEPYPFDEKAWYYFQLPFGRGVLAGGLTLMLVVLPIVIVSSQEALRAVPGSLREGALALGGTRWQMIRRMTLPTAVPGIMTGSILAMSRAIGEAAPILIISAVIYIRFAPDHLMDEFTAMPLQIYRWAGLPKEEFLNVAASGILVLLGILLTFNAAAVFIRYKFQKQLQ